MSDTVSNRDIFEALHVLRAQVETLQQTLAERLRVTLRPVQRRPFLGQPTTLTVTVVDAARAQPRVDQPVLLVTTWGQLRAADGYTIHDGTTVTVRTDVTGSVTVTLVPPGAEHLRESQQYALETMLALLDGNASTPRQAATGLQEMVRRYRQEANVQFRQAVDAYFRELYQQQFDAISQQDQMERWSYVNAMVLAVAGDHTAPDQAPASQEFIALDAAVQGAAVLHLRFKDWLRPWLQTYREVAKRENALAHRLRLLQEISQDPQVLLPSAHALLDEAVRTARGLVAARIETQAITHSLQEFMDKGTAELPPQARKELFAGLDKAVTTVQTAGVQVLTNLNQAGTDLRQELDTRVGEVSLAQTALANRIGGVEGSLTGVQNVLTTKADNSTVDRLQASFGELHRSLGTLQTDLQGVQDELKQRPDRNAFQELQGKLSSLATSVQTLQANVTTFGTRVSGLDADVRKLQTSFGDMTGSLEVLRKDVRDVQEELRRRPDVTVLNELQANVKALTVSLETLNTDVVKLREHINVRLDTVVTREDFASFRNDFRATLETKLDRQTLEQLTSNFEGRVRDLQGGVARINRSVGKLEESFTQLGENVRKIRVDLDRLRPRS
jgi:predicted nuclease with TOPRIM domain